MNKTHFLIKKVSVIAVMVGGLLMSSKVWADDTAELKDQIQALQSKVDQLQAQLASKQNSAPGAYSPTNVIYDQFEDPFAQMMRMQAQIDRNMGQAFADNGMAFTPRMDMKQTDKQYIVTMDIPGMDKDKINVEIKDGVLTVSGQRQTENERNNSQYYYQGRSYGSFMQAIPLPKDAKKDQIEAAYKNGVLTIKVGRMTKKEEKAENEKITIN
ncbi:MAG: Hsp20/alpha crystallin family protein [Candidatus Omnitrophica bacterium]|nr:Hsp20/alpha crystallin family protein [Candidatus Omnitrophota bacterium]